MTEKEEIIEVVKTEKDKPESLGQVIKQDGAETRKILSRIEKNLAGSEKVIKATRVKKDKPSPGAGKDKSVPIILAKKTAAVPTQNGAQTVKGAQKVSRSESKPKEVKRDDQGIPVVQGIKSEKRSSREEHKTIKSAVSDKQPESKQTVPVPVVSAQKLERAKSAKPVEKKPEQPAPVIIAQKKPRPEPKKDQVIVAKKIETKDGRDANGRFIAKTKSQEVLEQRKKEKQDEPKGLIAMLKKPFSMFTSEKSGNEDGKVKEAAGTAAAGPLFSAVMEVRDAVQNTSIGEKLKGLFSKKEQAGDEPVVEKLDEIKKTLLETEALEAKRFKKDQKLEKKQLKASKRRGAMAAGAMGGGLLGGLLDFLPFGGKGKKGGGLLGKLGKLIPFFGKKGAGKVGAKTVAKAGVTTAASGGILSKVFGLFSKKGAAKGAEKASGGILSSVLGKFGGKGAAKTAGKIGGKGLGKSLLKKIPGIGLLMGLGFGAQRLLDGDGLGALGEAASGIASTIPGLGTAISAFIDAGLIARDITKEGEQEQKEKKKIVELTPEKRAEAIEAGKRAGNDSWMKKKPIIAKVEPREPKRVQSVDKQRSKQETKQPSLAEQQATRKMQEIQSRNSGGEKTQKQILASLQQIEKNLKREDETPQRPTNPALKGLIEYSEWLMA
ncbi:hypothetical protein KKI24_27280 [bacterium]|nr:hypothetical protein [bacterium]